MGTMTAKEAAILRMAMYDEARALRPDMVNTQTIGGEFPKMLYRKTDVKDERGTDLGDKSEVFVANDFDGLLCETVVVENADAAETLAADGWDVSPQAAYGLKRGLVAATSAKDDEIAALRAEIDAMREQQPDAPRRGRPPKVIEPVE